MEWEKMFANDATDKSLISKIHNSSYKSSAAKNKQLIKKWAEDPNRHFSKADMQRANKHMKKCST